nr:hypothetical protein CFP56_17503 [Quercus suber]
MQDVREMRLDSDEGSSQGERSVSNVPKHSHHSEQDSEIENLQKQVRELEIEIRANVVGGTAMGHLVILTMK